MTVFLECKPDETVAIAVGVLNVIHQPGKGRVARALSKINGAIGLVDEDPGSSEPTLLRSFIEKPEFSKHDLRLREDKANDNLLIVICPRLEPWLIKTAKAANVEMNKFSLSADLQELDEQINQRLPNLKRLLKNLVDQKSERLSYLKSLLGKGDK